MLKGMVCILGFHFCEKFYIKFSFEGIVFSSALSAGGVCVCTLNLQCGVSPGETIPDAWHHQMVFGVGPQVGVLNFYALQIEQN